MMRWVVPAAVLTVLAPVTSGLLLPAAHAGLQPPGSCTYQAAFMGATLQQLRPRVSLVQAGAGFDQNVTAPPSGCVFTIHGVFHVFGAQATPMPCVPSDATSAVGGSTQCTGNGLAGPPTDIYGVSVGFTGTIRAVNDGVTKAVTCGAYFDTTGLAWCWMGDPNTVYTL